MATAFNLEFEKPLIELERQIAHLKELAQDEQLDVQREIAPLESKLAALRREIYEGLTPMQRVQVARHPRRPYTLDYLDSIFEEFFELKGDRLFRDDPAIVGGWARLEGKPVIVIGHQKGRDTKENLRRNFGMPHPEGCAAILWQDATQKERAAVALKLTARDHYQLGVIDEIVPEPAGGAHSDPEQAAKALQTALIKNLREVERLSPDELVRQRSEKYLKMGQFTEG